MPRHCGDGEASSANVKEVFPMTTLLKIDVSPRGDHSISCRLSAQFAEKWKQARPDGKVITRNLAATELPFVELPWIRAAFSDPSTHDEAQKAAIQIGNELIAELRAADEYLLATPMYNFNVPARLKAYIDHVVRSGQTFNANPDGTYTGLLTGKKATVIIASAGDYRSGAPAEGYDAERPYLRAILGFMGVTDVKFIQAGATWKVDRGVQKADEFLAAFTDQIVAAASV
jgi:FMN-dependent NADH-azoreductase